MIFRIDTEDTVLPSPEWSEGDGLLAVGGSLDPDLMIRAYSRGIFPWYSFEESPEPLWYGPSRRFVIFPEEIHVSHSMRQLINSGRLRCSINEDFEGVIRGCSEVDGRRGLEGAWLGEEMIQTMLILHERGCATSVEVWEDGRLVGGLYGVDRGLIGIPDGALFVGESMFSRRPSASKMALIHLAREMQKYGGKIIDCQFETPHLRSMGGRNIPYAEYMTTVGGDPTLPYSEISQ